jgi:hypothetical protein
VLALVWVYEAEEGGTKLTMQAEYVVPVPLLGKLAEVIIVKQNENEADALLANLKARVETLRVIPPQILKNHQTHNGSLKKCIM